jgi:hypothetical protein
MKTYNEEQETYEDARAQSYIAEDTTVAFDPEVGAQIDGDVHPNHDQPTAEGHFSLPTQEPMASGVPEANANLMTENYPPEPNVPLHCLRLDGGTQSRAAMDEAAIAEYTEAIRQGATLPPLVTFFDGVDFWLADGFHRYHAYRAAGVETVMADVRTGSKRDAVLFSVGANAAHGLRRTNDDKRRAVKTLLADPEWTAWTDVAIAKACGVSSHFVGDLRKAIIDPINDSSTRTVTRNSKTYEQNTANIGKLKPEPAVAQPKPADFSEPDAAPKSAKVRPVENYRTADDAELVLLRAENAALRAELDDVKASFTETLADNESMGRVIDADDKLKAAMDEVKRLGAVAESAERTLHAKSGEFAEAIRTAKYWKNRAEKAEKLNQAAA